MLLQAEHCLPLLARLSVRCLEELGLVHVGVDYWWGLVFYGSEPKNPRTHSHEQFTDLLRSPDAILHDCKRSHGNVLETFGNSGGNS